MRRIVIPCRSNCTERCAATSIEFWQKGSSRLMVCFEEEATDPRQAVQRTIALADLKRGDYRLVVSVRNREGQEIRRSQRVEIKD